MNTVRAITCILLTLAAALTVRAQTPQSPRTEDAAQRPDIVCALVTYSVTVAVAVFDQAGREVTSLRHTAFQVYEDGIKQQVDWLYVDEVRSIWGKQTIYKLGYHSTNERLDGALRSIRVDVQTEDGQKLWPRFYPSSYYANEDAMRMLEQLSKRSTKGNNQ